MKGLWTFLNNSTSDTLTLHLTSVSFASSWNEAECVVTLYYDAPFEEEQWKSQTAEICRQLNLLKLTGRSKGRVVWVGSEKSTFSDTVWLYRKGDLFSAALVEQVGVHDKVAVHYEKPQTAFFHPNGRVMLQALEWLISRLQSVVDGDRPLHMLEMYCGCGAHTVALASTGLLQSIVAVELDGRLVEACVDNCRRNQCLEGSTTRTPVHVVKGDAAEWARESRHTRQRQQHVCTNTNSALHARDYQVLLVDPPRMGLDNAVCEMAIKGTFEHVLYISCGRKALQTDLILLGEHFDVVDCTLLDLFPRTDSVESLVHLERRPTSSVADGCDHVNNAVSLYE
jgi:23S rRNA (uracil1939-C5)-methyltransferase